MAIRSAPFHDNGLHVADYFTPWNQLALATNDTDLGSGAPMLVPDLPGTNAHLLVAGGKSGTFYVLNRDQLTTNNTIITPPAPATPSCKSSTICRADS